MRVFKFFKFVICIVAACLLFGFVVEHLWNWLMPMIFGLRTISFVQAIGLLVLSKILLGGFHKHGHRGWKRGMGERFANMTPEERTKFREGMRHCGWGHRDGWGRHAAEEGRDNAPDATTNEAAR